MAANDLGCKRPRIGFVDGVQESAWLGNGAAEAMFLSLRSERSGRKCSSDFWRLPEADFVFTRVQ
jgi:hypothetical protein